MITPVPMDRADAAITTTPVVAVDVDDVRYYRTVAEAVGDRRNYRTATIWVLDRATGHWTRASLVTVAVYDTARFSFIATGVDRAGALAALFKAWVRHCNQSGADPNYLILDEVNTVTGPVGSAFRDWSPI